MKFRRWGQNSSSFWSVLICLLSVMFFFASFRGNEGKKVIRLEGFSYRYIPYSIHVDTKSKLDIVADSTFYWIGKKRTAENVSYIPFHLKGYGVQRKKLRIEDSDFAFELSLRPKDPAVTLSVLGKKSGDEVKRDDLLIDKADLDAALINYNIDLRFKVLGFDLAIVNENEQILLPSKGAKFSEAQKKALKELNQSTFILLKNIQVQAPTGHPFTVSPFSLFVSL
ncbi:GldM family protein [Saprospira grandis]|uniref:Gliding motility-associated protein GldM C-terminal domain-containing protein n=1 Tax=Saprospira grandis (strain Lewin) TaxID=984262 RepID=H6L063_SAPGL|nr:GldM family protein [Saprospira grandis]AFC26227.1 hypothetical protein SGRA_3503 [Saprospira grandis str. Lewin]